MPTSLKMRWTAALAIVVTACTPLPNYRYKMTIEVETPEGLRTGSSVIEVRARRQLAILPDMPSISHDVSGEAVEVQMPLGRNLYALLQWDSLGADLIAESALISPKERATLSPPEIARTLSKQERSTHLPLSMTPVMVTFKDINNPESIRFVDATQIGSIFGPGYRLKRVLLETTREAPRDHIENAIPWLRQFSGRIIVRGSGSRYYSVTTESFKA